MDTNQVTVGICCVPIFTLVLCQSILYWYVVFSDTQLGMCDNGFLGVCITVYCINVCQIKLPEVLCNI